MGDDLAVVNGDVRCSSHHVLLGPVSDPSLTPIDSDDAFFMIRDMFLQKFDLHPVSFGVTDSMPILPLEELDLLIVVGSGVEVINREDSGQCGPLLREVMEVARDLGALRQKS
ncbi:hypothetical protein BHE74_00040153 [Ensete ventricosum]|nr:hypothetical protein BHE74_00040153 [Ensete ventricosum]RZR95729.1 hypothetical protein BHM03_00024602 [Ensete ventricosum]